MAETWKRVAFTEDIVPPNLITNSGFGCWSQSDTNKGLGVMNFDAGDEAGGDVPEPGDTVTGGTSGATGKIISITLGSGTWAGTDAAGVITLGACSGRFHDNETITFSDGETALVNMPNSAPGVDLIQNGEFSVDTDPPPGWTASGATLTTEGSGQVGNCLKVLDTGAGWGLAYQTFTTEIGKIYKVSGYSADLDTGNTARILIGTYAGHGFTYTDLQNADTWTAFSFVFEATTTTTYISLKVYEVAGTYYFDEISCYEITPCCTGANTTALDGFAKDTTLDIYRVHNDGGTNTKDGSFYSLMLVPSTQIDYLMWPNPDIRSTDQWSQIFAGRDIVLGIWAKTSTANDLRLFMWDSTNNYSSYHTGGGDWEWLTITKTVNSSASAFYFQIEFANATPGPAYINQLQLSFGTTLPEGGYTYKPGEWVNLDAYIDLGVKTTPLAADDKILNLEALSEGRIPKGAKAVNLAVKVNNSSVTTAQGVTLRKTSTATTPGISCNPVVNNMQQTANGIIPCDDNGDIYQEITEADATLSGYSVYVNGIQVSL